MDHLVIARGTEQNQNHLGLTTKQRRHIDNAPRPPRAPAAMKCAKDMHCKNGLQVRSLDSTYNCMGMVFAARRTWIEPDQFDKIVTDDGYRMLARGQVPVVGDVAVYRGHEFGSSAEAVIHVGLVVEVPSLVSSRNPHEGIRVLSQIGQDGEYFHGAEELPEALRGWQAIEYWTDRKETT